MEDDVSKGQGGDEVTEGQPRPLLVEAMDYVLAKDEALDLGAGELNDSKHLISIGFKRVTAVDMDPKVSEKAKEISLGGFTFIMTTYDQFDFPEERYDLVNAQYALPFNPPETFNKVIESVIKSLKPGGVFVGQFFGERDSWNIKGSKKTFHTIDEAKRLIAKLRIAEFREEEGERPTSHGLFKHEHVFHFIAIK
jgi:SAM-dependent methyltransferase